MVDGHIKITISLVLQWFGYIIIILCFISDLKQLISSQFLKLKQNPQKSNSTCDLIRTSFCNLTLQQLFGRRNNFNNSIQIFNDLTWITSFGSQLQVWNTVYIMGYNQQSLGHIRKKLQLVIKIECTFIFHIMILLEEIISYTLIQECWTLQKIRH